MMYDLENDSSDNSKLKRLREQVPQGGPSYSPNLCEDNQDATQEEFPDSEELYEARNRKKNRKKYLNSSAEHMPKESQNLGNPNGKCQYIRVEGNEETHEEGIEIASEKESTSSEYYNDSIPDEIENSKTYSSDVQDSK